MSLQQPTNIVEERPAESAAATAGAIVIVLGLVGVEVDEAAVVAIIGGVAAIPAVVTAIVNRVRGTY